MKVGDILIVGTEAFRIVDAVRATDTRASIIFVEPLDGTERQFMLPLAFAELAQHYTPAGEAPAETPADRDRRLWPAVIVGVDFSSCPDMSVEATIGAQVDRLADDKTGESKAVDNFRQNCRLMRQVRPAPNDDPA